MADSAFTTGPGGAPVNTLQLAKAWVNHDNSNGSSCVIKESFNVSSVIYQGTGLWLVNFVSAFSSQYYSVGSTIGQSLSGAFTTAIIANGGTGQTPSSCQFNVASTSGAIAAANSIVNTAIFFGS